MGKLHTSIHVRAYPISALQTIASMQLSSRSLQVMREVDYAHSSINKLGSLSFTFWYNALPLITFIYTFHKVLESSWTTRVATHFHVYYMKMLYFGLINHIWHSKMIIKSIYLSPTQNGRSYSEIDGCTSKVHNVMCEDHTLSQHNACWKAYGRKWKKKLRMCPKIEI